MKKIIINFYKSIAFFNIHSLKRMKVYKKLSPPFQNLTV